MATGCKQPYIRSLRSSRLRRTLYFAESHFVMEPLIPRASQRSGLPPALDAIARHVLHGKRSLPAGSWTSAGILFLYAVPFSFAYTRVSAATGALILFGAVQLTMISAGLWTGERPRPLQWFGLGLSIAGLVYLLLPGIGTPSIAGAALMALAGFSWGVYSLRGRGAVSPLAQTTSNFVRSVTADSRRKPVDDIPIPCGTHRRTLRSSVRYRGIRTGYVIWYLALRGLTATRAAVVQLAVPILAAAGGVTFLGEILSRRLVIASAMVLGGIGLALLRRERL